MQLTRHTDFALRVLLHLGKAGIGHRVTVADIADQYEIPRNHLLKVVNRLGQHGYLRTIRGKGGGIELGCEPAEIRLGQVVRDMEARLQIVDCEKPPCPLRGGCRLKGVLDRAGEAFLAELDTQTLADMLPGGAAPLPLPTLAGQRR